MSTESITKAAATGQIDDAPAIAEPGTAASFDLSRLDGTNVNPSTLLATDYLNHFNNVEMILELLADAPECLEEIVDWKPCSYREHFAHSQLRDARIAVEAYAHVPADVRDTFENVVDRLNAATERAIATARQALELQNRDVIALKCTGTAEEVRALIQEAGAIINGTIVAEPDLDGACRDAVDALFDQ